MKYCKTCLQPDTRPGVVFGEDGVCAACRYMFEEYPKIDWADRKRQLDRIVSWAKKRARGGFDCLIGISGGKDSCFQAYYVKEVLGLKALLVNNIPDGITDVGRHNLENLVQHGFDMIGFRPNPRIMAALTRQSFFEHGNPVKPSEYPLYNCSSMVAVKFGIPLIVQGENPAITLGYGQKLKRDGDALNIRHHNTLKGCTAAEWVQKGIGLRDLQFYQWPDEGTMRKKVKGIHLNYYVKDWSWNGNIEFAVKYGLHGRPYHDPNKTGRLSPYTSIDSDMQVVNQMLKYYKFGFGFVTDEVCYDIRERRRTREESIELVERYDGKCDDVYINQFCSYVDITRKQFNATLDKFVNKKLFKKDSKTGTWVPRFKVGYGL